MKVPVTLFLYFFTTSLAINDEDGSYREDNSGQYVPDDSGRYIPDDSGKYIHDFNGNYRDDGTGRYSAAVEGRYAGDNIGNRRFASLNSNILGEGEKLREERANQNRFTQNSRPFTPLRLPPIAPPQPIGRYDERSRSPDGRWRILKQNQNVGSDGYSWEYETENGISAAESGKLANKGSQNEAMQANGFFQYTGPDNVVYSVTYRADENGFQPVGAHLPTPPPIPEAILRALESQAGSRGRKF